MFGSPERPGTSVNSVAAISIPRCRAADQRRKPVRQRRDGWAALPGAAIGAVAMQEIVLQIAENKRTGCDLHQTGSTIRLPRRSIRPTRPGSITVVASGARGWPARRSSHRPEVRVAPTPRCRAIRPRTRRAVIRAEPSRPMRTVGREHLEVERWAAADRRHAQRHNSHRDAGEKAAERGQICGLKGGLRPWFRIRPGCFLEAPPATARLRCESARGNACPAHTERRSVRPRSPRPR